MLLGLYQCPSPAGDIPAGLDALSIALAQAATAGVDMLTLPELFLPGYNAGVAGAQLPRDTLATITTLVAAHGVGLTLGLLEEDAGQRFNTAYSFDKTGKILGQHRKLQPFGPTESQAFSLGDSYTVFDFDGVRFGLLICYDVEFPEHVRALAKLGAEVLLVPTANMMPFVNVHQLLVPARAMENGITIVYANFCGDEAALTYTGLSAIYGPDGYILGSKGQGAGLCVAELPEGWSEHGIPIGTHLQDLRTLTP